MKTKEFRTHLTLKFPNSATTVNNAICICKKVEKYHGDLDEYFALDNCEELMFLLTYTADDNLHRREARHLVPCGGDIYTNTATFKKWINVYKEFCEKKTGNLAPINPINNTPVAGHEKTRTSSEHDLHLRQIDFCFDSGDDLDFHFVTEIIGYSKSYRDLNNLEHFAYQYFENVEGEWYLRSNKTDCYIKIVPSRISGSSNLKTFLDNLLQRNRIRIIGFLKSWWGEDEEDKESRYGKMLTDEDIYWEMREIEEINRNITGQWYR